MSKLVLYALLNDHESDSSSWVSWHTIVLFIIINQLLLGIELGYNAALITKITCRYFHDESMCSLELWNFQYSDFYLMQTQIH